MANEGLTRWSGPMLSLLRIMQGALLLQHGTQKLFGVPGGVPVARPFTTLYGASGIFEFSCGLLLLLGLFTRPAAFLASGMLAVAYFTMHAPHSFWPILNKGELAVIYCFVCLYLFVAGPGPWSLDRFVKRR